MFASKLASASVALALAFSTSAHAESWFQFEAGAGIAASNDSDGQWIQYAVPHTETKVVPAIKLGVTGTLIDRGSWGIDWHADALYISQIEASCSCVPDAAYNAKTHAVISAQVPAYFSGNGREIGFMLTLAPYAMFDGWKISPEGGAYIFRQWWDETVVYPNDPAIYTPDLNDKVIDASHRPVWQLTWTVGVSISRGHWTLAYHYLPDRAPWNPFPGLVQRTHLVTFSYRF